MVAALGPPRPPRPPWAAEISNRLSHCQKPDWKSKDSWSNSGPGGKGQLQWQPGSNSDPFPCQLYDKILTFLRLQRPFWGWGHIRPRGRGTQLPLTFLKLLKSRPNLFSSANEAASLTCVSDIERTYSQNVESALEMTACVIHVPT